LTLESQQPATSNQQPATKEVIQMMDIRRIQGSLESVPVQPGTAQPKPGQPGDFARALEQARGQAELRFSAHALQRMDQRGIVLSPAELDKIRGAVDVAAAKGSRSSLVLLEERAFVISVPNRTVITALEGDALRDQVVTQIDSAVIL
jgi:flagellar operon protein